MISPHGVALAAALLILGVHSSLIDDIRSKFGGSSGSLNSGLFARTGKAGAGFGGGFVMPKLNASLASKVHSSSSHKGQHHSSGSSSNTHSLTIVGADGKNLTEESSKKNGFNKDSKVDEAREDTMIKTADGGVVHAGKSHNKSSVDEGDYALESSKREGKDRSGNVVSVNNNKIANHTRAAALDEANEFEDLKGANGQHIRNNTGHKNTDEHSGKYELENNSASQVNADGTFHNVSNTKGSIGDTHKSDSNAYQNFESDDGKGNKQNIDYSKKGSSSHGSSADFASNSEAAKNADGTSFSNNTGSFDNKTFANANAEEVMSKKNVNADGTSSLEASHVGSNSSKIDSSSGSYADANAIGLNGTSSHVSSNKTADYSLDEANQSAGSVKAVKGLNGVNSISEKSIESGRKDESSKNTANDAMNVVGADGSKSSMVSASETGKSLSQRGNKTHQMDASVDAAGNVKNHTIDGSYQNKKTGEFGKHSMTANQKNADGSESMVKYGNDSNKNTYEAENKASENLLEKNADGTFKQLNKGSDASVKRTDGSSNVEAETFQRDVNGTQTNQSLKGHQAFNTSDARSNQYNKLHEKSANGTEVEHNQESKQAAASANSKNSMDVKSNFRDRNGNSKSSVQSLDEDSHDSVKSSSDVDALHVKHADGSETQSEDRSAQTANEHNDSAKKQSFDQVRNADGTFSEVSSDSATKNAQKDATDERSNAFVNKDAMGNSVSELKKSLVENHSNDTDASSNQKLRSKNKDGTEINDVKSSNVSNSALTEAQLASAQKSLQMADGSVVMSDSNSAITHEKNRNDADSKHKFDQKNKDGSSVKLDTASNSHSDLESRGESANKKQYQNIGGVESSKDEGYEKSMAKGGDRSNSHTNSKTDDGKGHFMEAKDAADSHHEIDNKDVKKHSDWIQM